MDLKLTNSEKYELLNIDLEELCKEIQEEILAQELYIVKEKELCKIKKAIGDCTELEFNVEVPQDNTRLSFYALNNQVIVIKRKRINIKLLLELMIDAFNFSAGNYGTKIGVILSTLLRTYLNVLDEDIAAVYSYLCNEYFINGRKFNNIEIYDRINEYMRRKIEINWSRIKINKILLQLENLQVVEFIDGILIVKDKIYFE